MNADVISKQIYIGYFRQSTCSLRHCAVYDIFDERSRQRIDPEAEQL